jgi:protein-tyrosine phosphatase
MEGERMRPKLMDVNGCNNFRDLGGYPTDDGHIIKTGQLYRSDGLCNLGGKGQEDLRNLGIKTVIDLRSKSEANYQPDDIPAEIEYVHIPMQLNYIDPMREMKLIKQGVTIWLDDSYITSGYKRLSFFFNEEWRKALELISDKDNRPLVFHCMAGKDRTGMLAAMILMALGAPKKAISWDYMASNTFRKQRIEELKEMITGWGIDFEKVSPYFIAKTKYLNEFLDTVEFYRGIKPYLTQHVGLTKFDLGRMREELRVEW